MGVTFSSLFMSIVTVLILTRILHAVLMHPKWDARFHPAILFGLILNLYYRLLFPFSWCSIALVPPAIDGWVESLLSRPILFGLNGHWIVTIIWVSGSLYTWWTCRVKEKMAWDYLELAKNEGIRKDYTDYLPDWKGPAFPVYITDLFSSPMVIAQGKAVMLPPKAYSQESLEYILRHEAEHLFNHDGTLITFFNLLKIIYWWLPIFPWLHSLFVLFMESRVDYQVTQHCSNKEALSYCESLVLVARTKPVKTFQAYPALNFIPDNDAILSTRLHTLFARMETEPFAPRVQMYFLLFFCSIFTFFEILF